MFQLTRELIINDCAGKLKAGKHGNLTFVTDYPDANGLVGKFATDGKTLYVDNFANFDSKKSTIKDVTYAAPKDAVKETAIVAIADIATTVKKDDVVRLVVTLKQEGRVISTYNDQYPDHKNRIFCEGVVAADADVLSAVKEIVANATKADIRMENQLAKLAMDDTDAALVVTCLDEFTRVAEIKIVKVGTDKVPSGELLTGYGDHVVLFGKDRKALVAKELDAATTATVDGVAVTAAVGDLGAGTTNILIRNNRLLTDANIDPYGDHRDERPVPGGKYTQFLIETVTDRVHAGHQVFGSAGDKSLVSHVIFALGTVDVASPAKALHDALKAIGVNVEEYKREIKQ